MIEVTIKQTVYEHGDVIELKSDNLPNSFKRKSFNKSVRAMVIKRTTNTDGISKYQVLLEDYDKTYVRIVNAKDVKYLGKIDDELLYRPEQEEVGEQE